MNYVPYLLDKILIEGKEYPCSLNPLFTSQEYEFVSAYQLIKDYKVPNTSSGFEAVIRQAVRHGMEEKAVREQLEYTILTDFILSNTDRHFNNFGFLFDPLRHQLVSMAPIFDTGNALFYNKEVIPTKGYFACRKAKKCFCDRTGVLLWTGVQDCGRTAGSRGIQEQGKCNREGIWGKKYMM